MGSASSLTFTSISSLRASTDISLCTSTWSTQQIQAHPRDKRADWCETTEHTHNYLDAYRCDETTIAAVCACNKTTQPTLATPKEPKGGLPRAANGKRVPRPYLQEHPAVSSNTSKCGSASLFEVEVAHNPILRELAPRSPLGPSRLAGERGSGSRTNQKYRRNASAPPHKKRSSDIEVGFKSHRLNSGPPVILSRAHIYGIETSRKLYCNILGSTDHKSNRDFDLDAPAIT